MYINYHVFLIVKQFSSPFIPFSTMRMRSRHSNSELSYSYYLSLMRNIITAGLVFNSLHFSYIKICSFHFTGVCEVCLS